MYSAFGVDHGDEVSKLALPGMASLGSKIAGGTQKFGQGLRRSGAANMSVGRQMGGSFGQGMQRGGAGRVKVGGQLKRLGGAMAAKPGLTGGLAIGGGTAAVGGAGYGLAGGRQKRQY